MSPQLAKKLNETDGASKMTLKVCTPQYLSKSLGNIIRPRYLQALTGLSRTTIWRLERAGEFPKRIKLSSGAVGYKLDDIQAWIDSRELVGDHQ